MNKINYDEAFAQVSAWHQDAKNSQLQNIDADYVRKAAEIVKTLHPADVDDIFLKLCALNLLNAAIKLKPFSASLTYDFKAHASNLLIDIDKIKDSTISYYYESNKHCLYIKVANIVFSFHHVPLITEILKASLAAPIVWPGIRLQKMAQPLLSFAITSIENAVTNIVN